MSSSSTVWIMIWITINRVTNSDSRYPGHDNFEDVDIIQADTREEVLAKAYGIRESNRKNEPTGIYDRGTIMKFVGPFEVPCNTSFTYDDGHIEYYFDEYKLMTEPEVTKSIDSAVVLYQLTK